MAVILKNGASRAGTRTNSMVPIRSSTITIAQTGLVSKLESEGKTVSALNLGYQGDHNVTRLYVKLWKTNTAGFANRYKAALVFHNEKNKTSYTASMERNDIDGYWVDLPDAVTKDSGNYQMYFLLKENLAQDVAGGGDVGIDDDPAYREVFVSDSWKGVISDKSAFSLIPKDFNWKENLYDYNTGHITPYSWEENSGIYTTSIYLPGLRPHSSVEDIKMPPVDGLEVYGSPTLTSNTYSISIEITEDLTHEELVEAFEKIIISYPVMFDVSGYDPNNEMHKKPIVVDFTPNSIKVSDNDTLGMKYDSYITPINVSSLYSLPGTTKKYVLFAKNNQTEICECYGNYCWIPAKITADAGSWQVAFIVKGVSTSIGVDKEGNEVEIENSDYIYNTGILKLSVVDNTLTKSDLAVDTAYRAVIDNEGKTLYDKNKYALYAQSTSSATAILEHSTSTINSAIGWVDAVLKGQITADDVISSIDSFEQVSLDYSNLKKDVDKAKAEIGTVPPDTNLQKEITDLNTEVGKIQDTIKTLDVTVLKETVDQNKEDLEDLKPRVQTLEGKATSLENKDKELGNLISSNAAKIKANEDDIKRLYSTDSELDNRVDVLEGRANTISSILDDTTHEVDELQTRTGLLEAGFESQKKYVAAQLNDETSKRTEEDLKLQAQITQEIKDRQDEDSDLQEQITTEVENRVKEDGNLQTQITNEVNNRIEENKQLQKQIDDEVKNRTSADESLDYRTKVLEGNSEKHNGEIQDLQTRLDAVEDDDGAYIKNNSKEAPETPYVVRIVFLSSEDEYNALETKQAGTLYLIQEDEE